MSDVHCRVGTSRIPPISRIARVMIVCICERKNLIFCGRPYFSASSVRAAFNVVELILLFGKYCEYRMTEPSSSQTSNSQTCFRAFMQQHRQQPQAILLDHTLYIARPPESPDLFPPFIENGPTAKVYFPHLRRLCRLSTALFATGFVALFDNAQYL